MLVFDFNINIVGVVILIYNFKRCFIFILNLCIEFGIKVSYFLFFYIIGFKNK